MGMYGCMKFAHSNGLIRSQTTCKVKGVSIPVAVDLWNAMYGMMERLYPEKKDDEDDSVSTLTCLFTLLRLIHKRALFPIFVFDGGLNGEVKVAVGAKAIVAYTLGVYEEKGHKFASKKRDRDDKKPTRGLVCRNCGLCTNHTSCFFGYCDECGFSSDILRPDDDCDGCGSHCCISDQFEKDVIYDRDVSDDWAENSQDSSISEEPDKKKLRMPPIYKEDAKDLRGQDQTRKYNTCRWSAKPGMHRVVHKLCIGVIRHLGYAYVEAADSEADEICANLFHTKTVSYVMSLDTDMLLMGCDMIVDITSIFPSVIRCKDVLQSLGLDYPTFLANFVRCHTDLHGEPTIKSVQEVVELMNLKPGLQKTAAERNKSLFIQKDQKSNDSVSEDEDSPAEDECCCGYRNAYEGYGRCDEGDWFVVVKAGKTKECKATRCRYPGILASDNSSGGSWREQSLRGGPCTNCPSSRTFRHDPIEYAELALTKLGPATTLCETLEREFVKHVVKILTPEKRTSRIKILKRVPIAQEPRCDRKVKDIICAYVEDRAKAKSLGSSACAKTPRVSSYDKVLISYWD